MRIERDREGIRERDEKVAEGKENQGREKEKRERESTERGERAKERVSQWKILKCRSDECTCSLWSE